MIVNNNSRNSNQIHHMPQQQQHHHLHHNQQQQQQQSRHNVNHHGVVNHNQRSQQNLQYQNRNSSSTAIQQNSNQTRQHNRPQQQSGIINNQQHHHSNQQQQQRSSNQNIQRQQQQQQQQQHQNNNTAQNSSRTNQNQTGQTPNPGPPPPTVLPKGWKREEIVRTKGITSGLVDIVYVPQANSELSNIDMVGKKFRNKLELKRLFGTKYDTALLDFKTGKVSQIAWRKQRRIKSLAANPSNYVSAAKYDNYLNLPIRQTASIFKQSVSLVTNNHKNEPTPASVLNTVNPTNTNGQQLNQNKNNEKQRPIQLFWELRLNNLRAIDSNYVGQENLNQEIDLTNVSKFENFETSNETVLRSVAASWYLNQNKILLGQEEKDFSKNARIFIDRTQPLMPQITIKEDELKQQELRIKEARKKLQMALKTLENIEINLKEEDLEDIKPHEIDIECGDVKKTEIVSID